MKTIQDYIDFFSAIPDEKWTTNFYYKDGRCCALGHLGARVYKEEHSAVKRLRGIVSTVFITLVNDGRLGKYKQKTPKARVLAALEDINNASLAQ